MRSSILLLTILSFLSSCSAFKSGTSNVHIPTVAERGMPLASEVTLPFYTNAQQAVAKVYRGNSFIQSGAFVSANGLFLTNFPAVLEYFNNYSLGDTHWLNTGFTAAADSLEIPLPGITLMVLKEQQDVTEFFENAIPDSASNYEIAQIKQTTAQQLIAERKGDRTDLFVQVNELHSGNRQLLEVYHVLNDIRLVYTPAIHLQNNKVGNSQELLQATTDQIAIVRAYWSSEKASIGFSASNIPYTSTHFLPLSKKIKPEGASITVGFPDRTFRQETARAFNFYYTYTNSYIIDAYEAFLKKEDYLASQDEMYAIRSISRRYNAAKELRHYYAIQHAFKAENLIEKKIAQENQLQHWITTDTTNGARYQDLLRFIDQAFDIAEQQGSTFYITSYALALSALDELASSFNSYLDADHTGISESQNTANLQSVVNTQQSTLVNTQIDAELELLKDFILILARLPKDNQMFSIQSIFEGVSPDLFELRAEQFITKNGPTSVLLHPELTTDALLNGDIYADSLFLLLDELLFTNQMARNNQSIYMGYLQPAQQVYNRALIEMDSLQVLHPDANGTLRVNRGLMLPKHSKSTSKYLVSANDFSGKSPGSVVLSFKGKLLGLIADERPSLIAGNYLYTPETAKVESIRIDFIVKELLEHQSTNHLLEELGLRN